MEPRMVLGHFLTELYQLLAMGKRGSPFRAWLENGRIGSCG